MLFSAAVVTVNFTATSGYFDSDGIAETCSPVV